MGDVVPLDRELPPCSHCKAALTADVIEVDIGVGVQRHTMGWSCPNGCPFGLSACSGCGVPLVEAAVHHRWCQR